MAAGEVSVSGVGARVKGGKAGATAHWFDTCGIVGISGAVVWGRHAGQFGVDFTSGC